ncbi:TIGR03943 family protein [Actinoallomurus sp. NPDC052274]|uniref:TIGR03943 family putative permease subunit n=1 Tax=Actinoallomurus sp. NPDC052274 TaxID=3155420 RepID=UPI0034189D34
MRKAAQNVVLLAVGGTLLWITLAGREYLNYVRPGFRIPLIATGAVLCALGGLGIAITWRRTAPATSDRQGDEHDHDHGPRATWLLFLPPLVIAMIAPTALGSFTAERAVDQAPRPQAGPALAALSADGPTRISLTEFTARAFQAKAGHDTLTGRQVILTGFARPAGRNQWMLIRLRMTCCAADAVPMRVIIKNTPAPPTGTWIRVTGTWSPLWASIDDIAFPQLTATGLERIARPADPYE